MKNMIFFKEVSLHFNMELYPKEVNKQPIIEGKQENNKLMIFF